MSSRDRILDAYESLLIEGGERAATLNAVVERAGLSKGGLLYHFKDKDALVQGQLDRLREMIREDLHTMCTCPEGASVHYVRSSAYEDAPLDRSMVAAAQLSQDSHPAVRELLESIHRDWYDLILEEVGDPGRARTILLIGDGLYYDAGLSVAVQTTGEDLERVVEVVRGLVRG